MRNLQEQVKKAFCYQKMFWPFTVWINCSSDLKSFANSCPSASNFKIFSQSVKQFSLTVGQKILVTKYHFPKENREYLHKIIDAYKLTQKLLCTTLLKGSRFLWNLGSMLQRKDFATWWLLPDSLRLRDNSWSQNICPPGPWLVRIF